MQFAGVADHEVRDHDVRAQLDHDHDVRSGSVARLQLVRDQDVRV